MPLEVAIDEAVRLAKRYASDDAARLVNGILGRIARGAGGMSERRRDSLRPGRGAARAARGDARRARAAREAEDPEAAIEVLAELAELAKEVEAELARAKREADAAR